MQTKQLHQLLVEGHELRKSMSNTLSHETKSLQGIHFLWVQARHSALLKIRYGKAELRSYLRGIKSKGTAGFSNKLCIYKANNALSAAAVNGGVRCFGLYLGVLTPHSWKVLSSGLGILCAALFECRRSHSICC